ncbi:tannase and feruloyl esterase-domain-containing protein [Mycena galopus ATCC 62051]|nr:tannase and feruloyl esterase-domain-containing protein [Mycena galopus ATCC 62051]
MVNHLWVATTILGLLPALVHATADPSAKCLALQNTLVLENTTILDITYRDVLRAGRGPSGLPFLNHPEVIDDYAFRAIHVEAVIGKQLVQAYYGTPAAKSYFTSCSGGGRQGMQAALKYPADFDGILVGSPATYFNHLLGWAGLLAHYIGATSPDNATTMSPKFLTPKLWTVLSAEILHQCDGHTGRNHHRAG